MKGKESEMNLEMNEQCFVSDRHFSAFQDAVVEHKDQGLDNATVW